jgi:hypothetical protein
MVAARRGLGHLDRASSAQSSEQHGGFDLGRAMDVFEANAAQGAAAQRQGQAVAGRHERLRPHLP